MEAKIAWWWEEVPALEVALGKGARNVDRLIPDSFDVHRPRRVRQGGWRIMATRANKAQFTQDVFARASCETGDENAAIPLPNRQAWIAIAVCGTAAHRDIAAPRAAQGPDNVDYLLRWPSGCKRHNSTSCLHARPLLSSFRSV